MAAVEVQDTAVDAAGQPAPNALVTVSLYTGDQRTPGTIGGSQQTVVAHHRPVLDTDGSWSVLLEPNANLVPAGTVYVVATQPPGEPTRREVISVPDVAGPLWVGDLLVDPPGALPSSALSLHEAAHPAHDASAVEVAPGAGVTSTDVQAAIAEITGFITDQEAGDSAAVAAVAAGLTSETTRAETAEGANAAAISAEATARAAGDATNATAIANETTRAQAAENGKQPHDADLDGIAALDSSTAGALVTDGAGWIRKTYAQLKTALGLANVDNTSDANKPVSTAQQAALDAKVDTAGTGLVKTGTTLRRAPAGSTFANLAALPSAAANPGRLERTADGAVYESDGAAWVVLVPPNGTYVPELPTVGSFTYDANGNPLTDPDGNTYTWNADGTVATQTKDGVTRTFSYDASGNLTGVA